MKLKELVTMTTRTQKFVIWDYNRCKNPQPIYHGTLEESTDICEYDVCLIEFKDGSIIVDLDIDEGERKNDNRKV